MAKLNPLALLARAPAPETRDFDDPDQPGEVLTLTLKKREYPDRAFAEDIAAKLVARFVEPPDGKAPVPWPPWPHTPIRWSHTLCHVLAALVALQCPEDEGDAYDAEELALLSVRMPHAWKEIDRWVVALESEPDRGNASAAREATSSAPPATSDAPTPPSTSTPPTPSGASTKGSDACVVVNLGEPWVKPLKV